MPTDGNKVSSCVGRGAHVDEAKRPDTPPPPPKECKDKSNLVRIGSRFFMTKRLNFGVEVGKSPSGIRVKSLNEVVSEKHRTFKPVNKKLPTFPGDDPPPLSPVSE